MRKTRNWNTPITGKYLDRMGYLLGVKRKPKEHDEEFRKRVIEAMNRKTNEEEKNKELLPNERGAKEVSEKE